jgi:hypothetical protein
MMSTCWSSLPLLICTYLMFSTLSIFTLFRCTSLPLISSTYCKIFTYSILMSTSWSSLPLFSWTCCMRFTNSISSTGRSSYFPLSRCTSCQISTDVIFCWSCSRFLVLWAFFTRICWFTYTILCSRTRTDFILFSSYTYWFVSTSSVLCSTRSRSFKLVLSTNC